MIRGAFPPISTRQSFRDAIEILSDLDDTYFDLTGATVQVSIGTRWPDSYGWGRRNAAIPYYDGSLSPAPILTCSTTDGSITNPTPGVYIFTFTPAQIATLIPGQYVVGANIARGDGVTAPQFAVQLALGDLTVLDGVVPQ